MPGKVRSRNFDLVVAQMQSTILPSIGLYRTQGWKKFSYRVSREDAGIGRIREELVEKVVAYGKKVGMIIFYDNLHHSFHFDYDLFSVTLTVDEAKAFNVAFEERRLGTVDNTNSQTPVSQKPRDSVPRHNSQERR
jgi:hypothetical protein